MVNESAAVDAVAVANRLRPALLKVARELRRESHSLGITSGQASLLVLIEKSPGIGVGELAARERISAAAMSGYVRRLEKAGFVERTADTGDRRRQGLTLSERGVRVLRSVRSRRTAWLATRLRALSDEERAAVDAAIDPMLRLLDEEGAR